MHRLSTQRARRMRLNFLWGDLLFRLKVCLIIKLDYRLRTTLNFLFVLEADMIEYFKQFGVVADAIVMRDRATGRGRGFGFVKMQFGDQEQNM